MDVIVAAGGSHIPFKALRLGLRVIQLALAAEIRGVDLSKPIADPTISDIYRAFLDKEVIYFRGRPLSDDDQVRFARCFGELLHLPKVGVSVERHPAPSVISNIRDQQGDPIGVLRRRHVPAHRRRLPAQSARGDLSASHRYADERRPAVG